MFKTQLQTFQRLSKYARWDWEKSRRETWEETIQRAHNFLIELSNGILSKEDYDLIYKYMIEMKAMPSMRLLAMAGPAARRDHISIYNCGYCAIDSVDSFVEALIISMAGCGIGYSVESEYVNQLPIVKHHMGQISMYTIEDSSQGWADSLRYGLTTWYSGNDVMYDYSQLRPAGSVLKVKGGRASGPWELKKCLDFVRQTVQNASGRKLKPIECHDIMCSIGECSISGGVRRTALISLFDWDDKEMREAKKDNFPPIRWNANNSIVWPDDIKIDQFVEQFLGMHNSQNGEPGIFNRTAMINTIPERRVISDFGINPCGEVVLKNRQFCNLSMAIARAEDTQETLKEKVKVATIIGTIQSLATDFKNLRPEWRKNCEEERLLGVDITGQMDCLAVQDSDVLHYLRYVAINTNKRYASVLGINQSASVTCVKPSGNSSVLFDCAPGIHARWSPYYIRNVRLSVSNPIFKVLRECNVPMNPENGQTIENATMWVVPFPTKSPDDAITRKERTAIEQCNYWLKVKLFYTEHNPSCTITYKPNELLDLMKWIWTNKNYIGGMSFLPESEARYAQMPYVEIDKEMYERLNDAFPKIDFSLLEKFEKEDYTTVAQEVACVSGQCELI